MRKTWVPVELTRCIHFVGVAVVMLVCLAGFVDRASGQVSTGAITGTVTDPKGAAVPDVSVVVRDTDTGLDRTFTTNDSGIYNAPLLQSGNYEVVCTKAGFATVDRKGVTVQIGNTLTIDIQMPLQTQQALVTVTTEAPVVETEKTEQSQTVSENLVNSLPIAARRWEDFVLLTPAVTSDGAQRLDQLTGAFPACTTTNSVDGANNNQAFFFRSARPHDDRLLRFTAATPSRNSRWPIAITAPNWDRRWEAQVNAVTKSGGNTLHGDLFENLRHQALNAVDPLAKAQLGPAATQSVHQQNQFGGSIGGPIIKDKLFFFVTYDGFRKVNPITYLTSQTAPTVSNLQCPATAFVTAAQCAAAKVFINTDELGVFPRDLRQDIAFGKLDYQLNQNNHLDAAFNLQDWLEPYAQTTSPSVNNSGATTNAPGGVRNRFLIASWTTTISNASQRVALPVGPRF